jgi:3-isopropylmalate/(R)-2-methylmalate dehydratase large subunit
MATIIEKVLARASNRSAVHPGEIVTARVDLAMANDFTAPLALRQFKAAGATQVFDPNRVCIVAGRHAPVKDPALAMEIALLDAFCKEQGIEHFYGSGEGMDHALVQELGLVRPGMLICNADSHACTVGALGAVALPMGSTDMAYIFAFGETWLMVPESISIRYSGEAARFVTSKDLVLEALRRLGVDGARYRSIEFSGPALEAMSVDERFTVTNMAIEMGAKTGIIAPDRKTIEFMSRVTSQPYKTVSSDADATFIEVIEIDATTLTPLVARPHLPSNVVPATQLGDIRVTQVNLGTCTNGRLIDLQQAAELLRGNKVAKGVRFMVTPATNIVYKEALKSGLLEIFVDAGAIINPPGCGPCAGWHQGALGPADVCLATHNRNFVGRMGHKESKVYLSSPYVAAATAITGFITDPSEVMQ